MIKLTESTDAHYGCPACRKYCSVTKAGVSACCWAKPDPSVTTVLNVISKPALIPWAVKMEREAIRVSLLDLLTKHDLTIDDAPDFVWGEIEKRLKDHKAAEKKRREAAEIGTAAHALIEWHTKRMLGFPATPAPEAPEASQWAFMAWQDWARKVNFKPVESELVVYSTWHGYIGTADTIAYVNDELTCVDYKTGKAVYREAKLQSVAYRCAYSEMQDKNYAHLPKGLILRLPKVENDPEFEAVEVSEGVESLDAFLGAKQLWRWLLE